MSKHAIKYEKGSYIGGGDTREISTLWCGREYNGFDWVFLNAQHVALAAGGSVQPCKNCIKAIIKELKKEL